ncbi:MAG: cytochrome c3 family protein [Opitutaceae bacterium]|nr:cytochrome c3 family protein [Opitutaceae bacterium]
MTPATTVFLLLRRVSLIRGWRALLLGAGCLLIAGPGRGDEPAAASAACLECHRDAKLTMQKAGRMVSLFADQTALARSAHSSLECADCHEGIDADNLPHKSPLTPVDCASCHENTGRKHAFHPRLALTPMPPGEDTACTACHGTHAVARIQSADFPFTPAQQTEACGRCHRPARDQFLASAHGHALVASTPDAPTCLTCHRKAIASPAPGRPGIDLKLAQVALCESCHLEKSAVASQTLLGTRFVTSFEHSVHGAALARGEVKAANCVDCHGSHQMNLAMVAGSRVNKQQIPATCAKCHEPIATEFESSVHAAALHKGNLDSPVCTTCHGEHDIRAHTDPASPVYSKNVAQQVCASCHASVRLTKKYGLIADSFQTFADSYHGLAARGGAVTVVNCASCHSSHAIKSHLDPTSTVSKDNLVATCGQCHPGANQRFTIGRVHASPDQRAESPILYWIANLYLVLIFLVIGGMTVHNLTDFVRKLLRKLALQKGEIPPEPASHRLYLRMTVHERLQHAAVAISFILLVLTGFMLRYPEAWWVEAIRSLSNSAFAARSLVHRLAGVALMAAGLWHVSYLALTPEGRRLFRDLLPAWRDLTDPWKVLQYNLRLAPEKPKFDRFSYIEKAEYWALIWGTVLMGATGAILWFENTSMGLFTKLGFDIARTVHFYEAILATLAILVWHFYFVIFNPDVYPMSLAWLTGQVSEHEMREDHPLELERLKQGEADTDPKSTPAREPDHPDDAPAL